MNKEHALEEVKQLVDYYKELTQKDIESFSEEDTKKDFILPLFHALGWQTNRRDVVVAEEQISKGFVDYSFRINGVTQFYLEAKPLKAELEDVKYAKQSINYAWLKNRTWAVLTDFEGIKVFNAQLDIKDPYYATVLDLKFDDFIDKFDKLCLLSPESFLAGDLDKYAEEQHKKKGGVSVSEQLADDLNEWREELAKHIKQLNKLSDEEIDDGVQKILDRLIFIRTCEDRGIEDDSLLSKYREWEDKGRKGNFQATLKKLFEEYNSIYNSGLFAYHPVVEWETYSDSFEKIIKGLYGASEDLIYDFKQIDADVLGSVYEQYLGFVQGKKEDKKDSKRKKQGIYYTPTYIVDYIVKNTLGELIKEGKDVSDIKVLDPACGSGSFLIKAFEYLVGEVKNEDKTKEYESDKIKAIAKQYQIRNEQKELPKSKKINILRNNIYGVDLDEQAIEIAKLNLLLKATDQKEKLPYLTNLRNGNSLVSGNEKELKEYFGKDWKDKKPFNWNEEFESANKQGGFDVVIGNPPYIFTRGGNFDEREKKYYYGHYKLQSSQINTFSLFIEQGLNLLKEGGYFGFIVPNNWLTISSFSNLREYLLKNTADLKIINAIDSVFGQASVDTCLLIFKKGKPTKVELGELRNGIISELVSHKPESFLNNDFIINITKSKDSKTNKIIEKINSVSKPLSDFATVSTGLKAYQIGKGKPIQDEKIKNERKYHSDKKESQTYIPYLEGSDVKRYRLEWSGEYLSYGDWLAEPRKSVPFNKDRILIRQIPSPLPYCINAVFVNEQYLNDINSMVVFNPSGGLDLKYILGILNSHLTSYWFANTFDKFQRKIFPQFKVNELARFPIFPADKKQQKEIIDLVNKMLFLNKQLQSIKDEEKSEKIKKEIEVVNDSIDKKVYGLYGI
jgi:type I restriction-modification system DNA methylase subunit